MKAREELLVLLLAIALGTVAGVAAGVLIYWIGGGL